MKPRKAKLVKLTQEMVSVPIERDGRILWESRLHYVAFDSAGRQFQALTEEKAIKMLEDYNK